MSQPEIVNTIIDKTLSSISDELKQKVDSHKIFFKWRELVGSDADEIFPVQIQGNTLILASNNTSLKDKFKYRVPQLISQINSVCGAEIVTKIIFAKNFWVKNEKFKVNRVVDKVDPPKITLTDDELADCQEKADAIKNPESRKKLFDCLVAKKKADKLKKLSSWQKCYLCENLCPPESFLCDICKINEHNKMLNTIRKIFYDAPATKFSDVQKKIAESMPHMRSECTLSTIESARMSLIRQTTSRLSINDKTSSLAKFFVMLVRQLPEESLTEKIIERTLHEFRFDLADRPPFKPQNFKKFKS